MPHDYKRVLNATAAIAAAAAALNSNAAKQHI
jgi:hypothetical protein